MTNSDRLTLSFTLTLQEGTSDKFYVATLTGDTITVNYGRVYSSGQRMQKCWGTPEAAAKEFYRLARDKMRKGYRIQEVTVGGDAEVSRLRRATFMREYGSVQRERAEISLDRGAAMIANIASTDPDEDALFESMFADGDAELISALARSHPAVGENDVAGLGAWLAGAKALGGLAFAS